MNVLTRKFYSEFQKKIFYLIVLFCCEVGVGDLFCKKNYYYSELNLSPLDQVSPLYSWGTKVGASHHPLEQNALEIRKLAVIFGTEKFSPSVFFTNQLKNSVLRPSAENVCKKGSFQNSC